MTDPIRVSDDGASVEHDDAVVEILQLARLLRRHTDALCNEVRWLDGEAGREFVVATATAMGALVTALTIYIEEA
jgi:hypothetical protein